MLSDMAASTAVYEGSGGILEGLSSSSSSSSSSASEGGGGESKWVVDAATLSEAHMQGLADKVRGGGHGFLEAPVSGSKAPAANGQLIFLCGGDAPVFEDAEVQADLGAMGKASYFLGDVGSGTRMKLAANMVMGTMLSALSEGLDLAQEAGLDPKTFAEVLGLGAMANPMFNLKAPQMISGSHPPNFPLKHAEKYMRLALALAQDLGLAQDTLPVARASAARYASALKRGWGDDDFSAVAETDER